jgi:hypothetical protein
MFKKNRYSPTDFLARYYAFAEGDGNAGGGGTGGGTSAGNTRHDINVNINPGGGQTQQAASPNNPTPTDPSNRETREELRARLAAERIEREKVDRELANAKAHATKLETDHAAALEAAKREATEASAARLQKMNQRILDSEVRTAAAEAGLVDLDLLPLLSREKITVDEDGNVSGVKEALEELKGKKPDWFRAQQTPPGTGGQQTQTGNRTTGNPAPPQGTTPPATNVRDMSAADYAAYKQNVLRGFRH